MTIWSLLPQTKSEKSTGKCFNHGSFCRVLQAKGPICTEHALLQCCRNKVVLSLQFFLLTPAYNCHVKYINWKRMLSVLPSLISRQIHKKKQKCTETSRECEPDQRDRGSRHYRWRCGLQQGRLGTEKVVKRLGKGRRQQEGSDRVRGLGVTERERACN